MLDDCSLSSCKTAPSLFGQFLGRICCAVLIIPNPCADWYTRAVIASKLKAARGVVTRVRAFGYMMLKMLNNRLRAVGVVFDIFALILPVIIMNLAALLAMDVIGNPNARKVGGRFDPNAERAHG